jgi:secondary thiamine-phosphate synthase enzyme
MTVKTYSHALDSDGYNDAHDLTPIAIRFLDDSGLAEGVMTVFVPGSTAAVTTIEFESGAVKDLDEAVERLVPKDGFYNHNERWNDGNGFSHVRAALLGPSLTVPFTNGKLILGTWQQIVLVDFDNRSRRRKIIFQVMGE